MENAITMEKNVYEIVMAPFLCSKCIQDFTSEHSVKCVRCGERVSKHNSLKNNCHACEKYKKTFDKVSFVGLYQGIYKQLIHLYKFKNKRQLAKPFAQLLQYQLNKNWDISQVDKIIPVPLHISRLRERGYNQALLMLWQWKHGDYRSKIIPKMLIRKRATETQTNLTRNERMKNMKSVFRLNPKYCVLNQNIIIIDDVYTTGATVHACAEVLKKNGAKRVDVLTLARA